MIIEAQRVQSKFIGEWLNRKGEVFKNMTDLFDKGKIKEKDVECSKSDGYLWLAHWLFSCPYEMNRTEDLNNYGRVSLQCYEEDTKAFGIDFFGGNQTKTGKESRISCSLSFAHYELENFVREYFGDNCDFNKIIKTIRLTSIPGFGRHISMRAKNKKHEINDEIIQKARSKVPPNTSVIKNLKVEKFINDNKYAYRTLDENNIGIGNCGIKEIRRHIWFDARDPRHINLSHPWYSDPFFLAESVGLDAKENNFIAINYPSSDRIPDINNFERKTLSQGEQKRLWNELMPETIVGIKQIPKKFHPLVYCTFLENKPYLIPYNDLEILKQEAYESYNLSNWDEFKKYEKFETNIEHFIPVKTLKENRYTNNKAEYCMFMTKAVHGGIILNNDPIEIKVDKLISREIMTVQECIEKVFMIKNCLLEYEKHNTVKKLLSEKCERLLEKLRSYNDIYIRRQSA